MLKALLVGGSVLAVAFMAGPSYGSFFDGFETYQTGPIATQGGWAQNGGSTSQSIVVNDSGVAYQGDQYLQISASSSSGAGADTSFSSLPLDSQTNNEVSYALRWKANTPNSGNGNAGIDFKLYGENGGDTLVNTYTYADSRGFGYRINGVATYDDSVILASDTWYNFIYDLDPAHSQARIRIMDGSNPPLFDQTVSYDIVNNIGATPSLYAAYFFQDGADGNSWLIDNLSVQSTPEPATLSLLGLGGLLLIRRRRAA
jgi:hypothetical protein